MLMTFESGKPLKESHGEFTNGCVLLQCVWLAQLQGALMPARPSRRVASIEWFAEECKRVEGDILQTVDNGRRQIVLRQPLGVAAAITPWSAPFVSAAWDIQTLLLSPVLCLQTSPSAW